MNFLSSFPDKKELLAWYDSNKSGKIYQANGHLHTPFSFSAFTNIEQMFTMAKDEDINILGINDFYVTDGYSKFHELANRSGIFPLFNIEFIGLLEDEQRNNIKVNDPDNPGRTYFSGKGLNFPPSLTGKPLEKLQSVIEESQKQVKAMIDKLNDHLTSIGSSLCFVYSDIKQKYAQELVRERHIAKAIRIAIFEKYQTETERLEFLKLLYNGKQSVSGCANEAALENEIRSNLLKAGGKAFVTEDPKAFLRLDEVIEIIVEAGGIPCYPVLLDDKNGKCTEYESDKQKLYEALKARNINCIELIPGRNGFDFLKDFVLFFNEKDFVITFGTEHNSPVMQPIKIDTRGGVPLDDQLLAINYEGVCVIAAHQYLSAKGMKGFTDESKINLKSCKAEFVVLGKAVFDWYFKNNV